MRLSGWTGGRCNAALKGPGKSGGGTGETADKFKHCDVADPRKIIRRSRLMRRLATASVNTNDVLR